MSSSNDTKIKKNFGRRTRRIRTIIVGDDDTVKVINHSQISPAVTNKVIDNPPIAVADTRKNSSQPNTSSKSVSNPNSTPKPIGSEKEQAVGNSDRQYQSPPNARRRTRGGRRQPRGRTPRVNSVKKSATPVEPSKNVDNHRENAENTPINHQSDIQDKQEEDNANSKILHSGNERARPLQKKVLETPKKRFCSNCRKGPHLSSECRGYRELYCFTCSEQGHKAAACPFKRGGRPKHGSSYGTNWDAPGFGRPRSENRSYISCGPAINNRPNRKASTPLNDSIDVYYELARRPPSRGSNLPWMGEIQRHTADGPVPLRNWGRNNGGNFNGRQRKRVVAKKESDLKTYESMSSIVVNDGGVYSDEEDDYDSSGHAVEAKNEVVGEINVLDRILSELHVEASPKCETLSCAHVSVGLGSIKNETAIVTEIEKGCVPVVDDLISLDEGGDGTCLSSADADQLPCGYKNGEVLMPTPIRSTVLNMETSPSHAQVAALLSGGHLGTYKDTDLERGKESSAQFIRELMKLREFRDRLEEIDKELYDDILDELFI